MMCPYYYVLVALLLVGVIATKTRIGIGHIGIGTGMEHFEPQHKNHNKV